MLVGAAIGAVVSSAIDIGLLASHDHEINRTSASVTWLFTGGSLAMFGRF